MKKAWFLVAIAFSLLILPLASAEVQLSEKPINSIVVKELTTPAKFDITIKNNNAYSDSFVIDTLLDINITPKESVIVDKNSEKTVTVEISPSDSLRATQSGSFSFEYYAKGDKSGTTKSNMMIEFVPLSDLILTEMPASVKSTDTEIPVKIKLSKDISLDASLTMVSELLSYAKTVTLSNQATDLTVPLKSEMPQAGVYTVKSTFTIGGYDYTESKDMVLESVINVGEESAKSGNFLSYKSEITKENSGNSVTDVTVTVNKAIFASMFTSFNIKPTSVKRSGNMEVYEFTKELNPGEKLTVIATTSYAIPLVVLILLIVATWILIVVLTPQIKVSKKAVKVRTKSGVFATKIVLSIKNKGKEVTDLKIIDRLPAFTELVPEKFGTISPSEIRKKTLIWHVDRLGVGEEIMLSYIVYSKLTIIGKLDIPISFTTYKDVKGNIHEAKSNMASVLIASEDENPQPKAY